MVGMSGLPFVSDASAASGRCASKSCEVCIALLELRSGQSSPTSRRDVVCLRVLNRSAFLSYLLQGWFMYWFHCFLPALWLASVASADRNMARLRRPFLSRGAEVAVAVLAKQVNTV